MQGMEIYEARARIVKSLAHPSRLLMVDLLRDGPRCVCELREAVGSDLSTVSKHLAVLRHAGIVQDEKRGLQVFYTLRCPCVTDFLACAEKILLTNAKDHLRVVRRRGAA